VHSILVDFCKEWTKSLLFILSITCNPIDVYNILFESFDVFLRNHFKAVVGNYEGHDKESLSITSFNHNIIKSGVESKQDHR
jgi:hypothetical protein